MINEWTVTEYDWCPYDSLPQTQHACTINKNHASTIKKIVQSASWLLPSASSRGIACLQLKAPFFYDKREETMYTDDTRMEITQHQHTLVSKSQVAYCGLQKSNPQYKFRHFSTNTVAWQNLISYKNHAIYGLLV